MLKIPDELFARQESAKDSEPQSFESELAAARQASAIVRASAQASRALHDLDHGLDQSDTDPSTWADSFTAGAQKLRDDQLASIQDPAAAANFQRDFDDLASAKLAIVRRIAASREIGAARSQLDDALTNYAALAADASSDVEARIIHDQADAAIARTDEAGILRAGEAGELRQSYAACLDKAQLDRMLAFDPTAAESALNDPNQFASLTPETRLRLQDRARIRIEDNERRERQAADQERTGRFGALLVQVNSGDADRTDIMQASSDGWLRPQEHDRALSMWNQRRAEIERHAKDIERVSASLDGTGVALDPESMADRTAVDAHFDETRATWIAAGLKEDQLSPLITDYVNSTGILPSSLNRDLAGAFRTGDAQARVAAAEQIAQLPSTALTEIDQRDGAEALLIRVMKNIGWSPDLAADRAAQIMSGTIDPNDRFIVQERAAITAAFENPAGGNIQVASLPGAVGQAKAAPEVTSDADRNDGANVRVAIIGIDDLALVLFFGGLAAATLITLKNGLEGAQKYSENQALAGEGNWPPRSVPPPPPPLPRTEIAPNLPNELPNVPPLLPPIKEEIIPQIIEDDELVLPEPDAIKPSIHIYVPAPSDLRNGTIVYANENEATKAQGRRIIQRLQELFPEAVITKEHWIAGPGKSFIVDGKPGDGRPYGKFADYAARFPGEDRPRILIQLVDVDKNNYPTDREWKNAEVMRQHGFYVVMVAKQWQVDRNQARRRNDPP